MIICALVSKSKFNAGVVRLDNLIKLQIIDDFKPVKSVSKLYMLYAKLSLWIALA